MVQLLRTSIACAALVMAAVTPAIADEYVSNPGPVGPNEPILLTVGGQRVIAFFVPERGSCRLNTIMWKDGADGPHALRVRLSLRPGQMARFDEADMSINLLCGVDASTLAVVAPPELLTREAAKD
jgi:hypothetical protein